MAALAPSKAQACTVKSSLTTLFVSSALASKSTLNCGSIVFSDGRDDAVYLSDDVID